MEKHFVCKHEIDLLHYFVEWKLCTCELLQCDYKHCFNRINQKEMEFRTVSFHMVALMEIEVKTYIQARHISSAIKSIGILLMLPSEMRAKIKQTKCANQFVV